MECGFVCICFTLLPFFLMAWEWLKNDVQKALDLVWSDVTPLGRDRQSSPEKVIVPTPVATTAPTQIRPPEVPKTMIKTIHEVREELEGLTPLTEDGDRLRESIIGALERLEKSRLGPNPLFNRKTTWGVGADGMPVRRPTKSMTEEEVDEYLQFWQENGAGE